jgi:peptidoglycan/LPS O-acetylase OafA/YrhL
MTAGISDTAAVDVPRDDAGMAAARPASPADANYLPTLDGWRGVAIFLVLCGHGIASFREAFPSLKSGVANAVLTALGDQGGTGVHIFFGLSGFLICTRLLRAYATHGRLDLKTFYIRRAHRILPALLVFLLTIGLLGLSGVITLPLRDWLFALCFGANYQPEPKSWYVEHFWTLAMEEHFYLFFPTLLAPAGVGSRRALRLTIALALAVAVWRAVDVSLEIVHLSTPWHRTDTACDGLLWGCVLAMLFDDPATRDRLTRILNPRTFAILFAIFCVLAATGSPSKVRAIVNVTAQMLIVPLMLVATLAHPTSPPSRVLEWSALRWLGRLSYSLYLWQQLFLAWKGSRSPFLEPIQTFPLNFPALFATAAMSYYFIEKPLIRAGYRATSGRS